MQIIKNVILLLILCRILGINLVLLPSQCILEPITEISVYQKYEDVRQWTTWLHQLALFFLKKVTFSFFLIFNFLSFFVLSRAAPVAHGGSQARSLIGAVATSLRNSHSNAGSKPHLQPTPQLTATLDP